VAYLDYLQQHGASGPLAQPVHWMKAWLERWSKPSHAETAAKTPPPGGPAAEAPHGTADGSEPMADRILELEKRIATLEKERAKE
jgi:hypothetical protein